MKIVLTEMANMKNGGYSWISGEEEHKQADVTGLTLDVMLHNNSEATRELTLGGFHHVLAPGEVLVSRETLEYAGFHGFKTMAAYKFMVREFSIMEA